MKKKTIVIALIFIVIGAIPIISSASTTETTPPFEGVNHMSSVDLKNAEKAKKLGIIGYVEVNIPNTKEIEIISKGSEITYDVVVTYHSYSKNHKTTTIIVDPNQKYGLKVEKKLGNGKGSIVVNDLVSYSPMGKIVLEDGKPTTLEMTIKTKKDIESVKFPIVAVGICADVPISTSRGGSLIVQ